MVIRVNKNRRVQRKVVAAYSPKLMSNASSELVDDNGVKVVKERRACPHLDKGIDFDKLLVKLRSSEPIRCEDCKEGGRGSKGKGKFGKKGGVADAKSEFKPIWICMECGHYACAGVGLPTASTTHAARHIRQTRHHLMIQWDNPQLRWCFPCSTFIPGEKSEENGESKDILYEVVKLIKDRSSELSAADGEDVWFGNDFVQSATKSESINLDRKSGYVIRGLVNLGNTCFFNSVMQNLLALDRLRNYFFNLDLSNGKLTFSLKSLFSETKSEMGSKFVINPKSFYNCLCAKASQFGDKRQHDSHELLHCLLDELRTEDLALKKCMNASENEVDSANQDISFVDAAFGGQISSTLRCVDCGHSSTIYEPFLDLSLSLPTKKGSSKQSQPVSRVKKTKLPPRKVGRAGRKVSKDAYRSPIWLSASYSPNQRVAVPQTDSRVASSSDSSSVSVLVGPISESIELGYTSQNLLAVTESENEQVMEKTVEANTAWADKFSWMDDLGTENILQENAAGADEFTWMGCFDSRNHDLISKYNDTYQFFESKIPEEPNSSENLQEELPLLIQESQVLFLPYKEEIGASLSNIYPGYEQEEVEFDGFIDLFNEPEIAFGPSSGSVVYETGILGLNISESDPDEVDNRDFLVSVESCLADFIKPELLSEDNAWNCNNCAKTLLHQKLESKNKMYIDLVNGGESPSSDKEVPRANGAIINGDISSSGESLVSQIDSCNQNCNEVENGLTSELNSFVSKCEEGKSKIEDASLMKSNSSVSIQPVGSSHVLQLPESGEDEEIDSESVKVKRNAIRSVHISKTPPILSIHLKRFSQDTHGRLSKLNGHVKFGETIDLRPYVDPRCEDIDSCIYHLVGVVEHLGTMGSGHYIAYVRGGEKRNEKIETEYASSPWYYASDRHIRQVSLEEVLRSEAYILFYEKN